MNYLTRTFLVTVMFTVATCHAAPKPATNFVFFLVDDLGWADTGFNGSKFYETPHIDRLASSGMRFTNAYAACPVCSPTRASILTGRHPVRVDITDWIPGSSIARYPNARFGQVADRDNLALAEVTIAEVLQQYGYRTFFAGKWHLGEQGHWPTDQGFDVNIGGNSKGSPPGGYYAPWKNPTLAANHDGEYLTERLTDECLAFLERRQDGQPFLLYLSYYNVHTPITAYQKRIANFQTKSANLSRPTSSRKEHEGRTRTQQDNPAYASMITAVDDSVGRILNQLDMIDAADNTVVIFFSDNGGLSTLQNIGPTSNEPLRAGKGWLYEGGIREPMIIRAPGVSSPQTVCDVPVISMDFFPTILELAGLPLAPTLHCDGISLVPRLQQHPVTDERVFYWHYPHYHGSTWTPGAAIRSGDWKLIEFYHWDKMELYNLSIDPRERNNLAVTEPATTKRLLDQLHTWQQSMQARMPPPKTD